MRLAGLGVAVVALLGGPAVVEARQVPFGPRDYVRRTGAPEVVQARFVACRPERSFRLVLENGPEGRGRASRARIWLNGVEVVRPQDLSEAVGGLERPVGLQGDNTLGVELGGRPGSAVRLTVVSEQPCLEVVLREPRAGAVVGTGWLVVRGEVRGVAGVGVVVNGVPAAVEGEAFAALVPVESEVGELVAVATAPDGETAETRQPVTVSAGAEAPGAWHVFPPGGAAPLRVGFELRGLGAGVEVEVDFEGDGTVDARGPALGALSFTYDRPGVYVPQFRVVDAGGQGRAGAAVVVVYDRAGLDARLQAVWQGFTAALRAGDVARALEHVHHDARDRYEAIFRVLGSAGLAGVDRWLPAIRLVEVGYGGAQYELLREREGQVVSFAVWFQVDRDGVWRVRRF